MATPTQGGGARYDLNGARPRLVSTMQLWWAAALPCNILSETVFGTTFCAIFLKPLPSLQGLGRSQQWPQSRRLRRSGNFMYPSSNDRKSTQGHQEKLEAKQGWIDREIKRLEVESAAAGAGRAQSSVLVVSCLYEDERSV